MNLAHITPVILTFNEAPNLRRCLERLNWAACVLVIDSGSTDETCDIARTFTNVRVLTRPFDDHTTQWNFGVDNTGSPWVLAMDADYVLETGFEKELAALSPAAETAAFYAAIRYLIHGKPLRASLYPPRAVLFRKDRCRYERDGHTQLLRINGGHEHLKTRIGHDDRKPLSRWFASQDKYARLEAEKLMSMPSSSLRLQDRIRRTMVLGPVFVFLYTLLARGMVLDGWRGWYYTFQRTTAEIMLSLHLLERRIKEQG
jgi:glycosyltransferase involved in cell wall biosynthesis